MFVATDWKDYECIDSGDGERLERWGNIILRRPDPQIIWPSNKQATHWKQADAHFRQQADGKGQWQFKQSLPERWMIEYHGLRFHVKPTTFKHTGLFPEQAVNWQWMMELIRTANRPIKVLNLFGYTGGASVACAAAGAEVCHIDASKAVVGWAKENLELSKLTDRKVRFINDDVFKFVQREQRRGNRYDAIIMDPPPFGRGPNGETWKFETSLYPFIETCASILTDQPLFFLINAYKAGFTSPVLANMLTLSLQSRFGGLVSSGEVGLPITASQLIMPCGTLGRWQAAN